MRGQAEGGGRSEPLIPYPFLSARVLMFTSPPGRGAGAWEQRSGPGHASCWHGLRGPSPSVPAALASAPRPEETSLP